jgi:hypothetical protein
MVETLSNMSAPYSSSNNQKVYDAFLNDLKGIQSSQTYASNTYMDGQAYSLLFMNELKIYFVNSGNVSTYIGYHILIGS